MEGLEKFDLSIYFSFLTSVKSCSQETIQLRLTKKDRCQCAIVDNEHLLFLFILNDLK